MGNMRSNATSRFAPVKTLNETNSAESPTTVTIPPKLKAKLSHEPNSLTSPVASRIKTRGLLAIQQSRRTMPMQTYLASIYSVVDSEISNGIDTCYLICKRFIRELDE